MKKLISLILALSMLMSVGLTSCVKKEDGGKTEEAKTSETASSEVHGECKNGKDHTFTTETVKEDCTSRGYTLNTCKTCGYVYLSNTKAALGHDFGEEVTVTPLSCTDDGAAKKTCARCGVSSESVLPHTGHNYELTSEESADGDVYVCTLCGDTVTLGADETLPVEMEDSVYLPDRPRDFSFTVRSESLDTLKSSLTISGDNGNVAYNVTAAEDGSFTVNPKKSYDEYGVYTATLTEDASFEDYNTRTLEFSIVGPDRADVDFKDDIVFLKKLAEKNSGYSPEAVEWDEAAERYYVTLSGKVDFDRAYVGKIIAAGDYTSTEEIVKDPTRELVFGKLAGVTHNAKGKTVLEMTAPEISDVFSEYDLYFSGGADSAEPLTLLASDEELELEFAEAVVMSDGFAEYMATVQLAAGDYADSHGLEIVPLSSKKEDGLKFELTDKSFTILDDENGANLKLGGKITYTIDLKNKYKNLNAGSVVVTCTAVINTKITIGGNFEKNEKADLSVQNTTVATLGFSVNFKLDYSKDYEEKYYVHNNTKKIHTSSCRVVTNPNEKKLTAYSAEELAKLYNNDKEAMKKNECKLCYAVSTLDGTGYILNKDSGVLHCMNCMHVKSMKNSNIYTVYPANTSGFTTCKTCKPEERQMKDFEARMFNKLHGGDMADEMNAFQKVTEEIFGKSKAEDTSDYPLSIPINICGVMNIELGAKLVFEIDIEASVDFTVTATSSTTFGIRSKGKDGGFETYKSQEKPTVTYGLSFMGEADAKLGVGLIVKAYPVGFEKAAVIQVTGKVGVYGHLTGVFSTSGTIGEDNDTYCGARLDVGIFFDVDGYWKILWFDDDFTIVDDKRFSLIDWGFDRVYYSFVDEEIEVDLGNDASFELGKYCNANYLDLASMEKKSGLITSKDISKFKINVECKTEDGSGCDYLKFKGKTWTIDRTTDAPDSFTAYVYVTFEPRIDINNIEDFFKSNVYGVIYDYSLDPLVIKVTADKPLVTPTPDEPSVTPNQTITVPKGAKTIGMGYYHISALKTDGTVVTIYDYYSHHYKVDTSTWTDIVAISSGNQFTAGLKNDGTVVVAGSTGAHFDVTSWTDIVAIAAGDSHLAGLKADGTVVVTGQGRPGDIYGNNLKDISSWKNISRIYCPGNFLIGIKNDGSVVIAGDFPSDMDFSDWTDIVEVSACGAFISRSLQCIVGLKSNGTVVVCSDKSSEQFDVSSWKNITHVYAVDLYEDSDYIVGIKADGTVVVTEYDGYLNNPLLTYDNIVDMALTYENTIVVLKSDGTIDFYSDRLRCKDEDLALLTNIALPTR